MNTILQKRIEGAANHYLLHEHKSPLNEILHQCDLKTEMQYHKDIEQAYIEGGKNSLQNQWISADEALPEVDGHGYSKPVLVISDTNELLVATYSKIYNKWNNVDPLSYHRLVVTHWMTIPSLKGGEE